MTVSAAILNWNGGELAIRCLLSLTRQTCPVDQMILVDNGSTDGSRERLMRAVPDLHLVANESNQGFARAANQAVAAATGDWLLLANLDVEFEPDYVARLVAAGESDPAIGSVTGKLLRAATRANGGHVVDSTGHVLYRNGWAMNQGEEELDVGQWDEAREVFGVTGAAPLYRVRMLEDVVDGCGRPFDERFFAYIEDVDLDWRMRWLGWKARYEPAVAWHHRSATGARRSAYILRHILKNRLLLVANNDLWPGGLARIPTVGFFTLLTALQFALESPTAPLGIVDFVRLVPASISRRRFLRRRRRVPASDITRWMEPFPYWTKIRRRVRSGGRRPVNRLS